MRASIISIGNSKGIRIPKSILEESGLGKEVDLKVKRGEIRIAPLTGQKKVNGTMLLSEKALAVDWMRPEEDEAWKSLK